MQHRAARRAPPASSLRGQPAHRPHLALPLLLAASQDGENTPLPPYCLPCGASAAPQRGFCSPKAPCCWRGGAEPGRSLHLQQLVRKSQQCLKRGVRIWPSCFMARAMFLGFLCPGEACKIEKGEMCRWEPCAPCPEGLCMHHDLEGNLAVLLQEQGC